MTITNPQGKVAFHESEYSCIEMLYAARNGGLSSSECEAVSTSEIASKCGGCIETKQCKFDQPLCRSNQILVASNPDNYPGWSTVWSSALTCQELIDGARSGDLLSNVGCSIFYSSIEAAFQTGTFGLGVANLKECGLQCNYNENASAAEETKQQPAPIQNDLVLSGKSDIVNGLSSDVPSDSPSLLPSDGPSVQTSRQPSRSGDSGFRSSSALPSDGPSLQPSYQPIVKSKDRSGNSGFRSSAIPSDGPSLQPSDEPSLLDEDPKERLDIVSDGSFENSSLPTDFERCLLCNFENDSAFYLYKDFGQAGTTFSEALSAPDHREECKEREFHCNPKEPLYPDLDNCYLADVTSFDDLIGIQAVIPPKKAAYVSVYKDTIAQFNEAKGCNQSVSGNSECRVEKYKQNLVYGNGKSKDGEDSAQISMDSEEISCTGLKEGWFNYGSDVAVPTDLWRNGQPSYCFSGPIQNAAAVWPVHPNGSNYGDMRDVNAGWKLTGAVYKCCKSLHTCTVSASAN